jgi:hypothetical protein
MVSQGVLVASAVRECVSCQVCKSPPEWSYASYPTISCGCSVTSSFLSSFAKDPALK